jgi:hypothetical protein
MKSSFSRWKHLAAILVAFISFDSAVQATIAAKPVEKAMPTSEFIDTIGVNTHFNYAKSYRSNAPTLVDLLGDSGIRHIRDGSMGYADKTYISVLQMLAARGEKLDMITDERQSIDWTISQSRLYPAGMLEAYENPNELDLFRGGNQYISTLRSFTPALYQAVKGDSRTNALAVIGPSLTTARAYAALGDLSAYTDYGNLHNYVFGRPPGTPGWGSGHYGSIAFMMSAAKNVTGSKPVMTTEAGWGTSSKYGEVTEAVQLKYLTRFFFEQVLHGIRRTYTYEFYDEGPSYNTFGLVRSDFTPKPAYAGIRNMIKLFGDSGAPRRDEVNISVDAPATVHHLLLEKSDGRRYLAIWNEESSIALRAGDTEREEQVEPQTARVSIDGTNATAYTFDRSGSLGHVTASGHGEEVELPVTDFISILEWRPNDKG